VTDHTTLYPVRIRPHHLETEDSYTRRLLAANFETEAHKRVLLRAATKSAAAGGAADTWEDILTRKTRRTFHFGELSTSTTTDDAHVCEYCPDFAKRRVMCVSCALGARVEQAATFSSPVCVHHKKWVGPTPDHRIDIVQPLLDDRAVRAGIRFERLRRQGRMTPALYETIRTAARPCTFGVPVAELDAAALPLVVALVTAVTARPFVNRLFAPGGTYADAFIHLKTTVETLAGATGTGITLALWEYFKASFWVLRHAVRTLSAYEPAWEHDFVVPRDVADAYIAALAEEPFANYSAVARQHAGKTKTPPALHRGGMTICENGHHVKAAKHCPVCKNSIVHAGYNDLATVNPTLASQLDPVLNGTITAQTIAAATHRDLAWRCPRAGHVYWATGSERTQGKQNCGICSGRTIVPGVNDITTTHPTIAAEIHPDYAKGHPPARISAGSEVRPEWLCPTCGRTYKMTAYDRTHGEGCDPCRRARLRASKDNLAVTHPQIAAQWHPSRNNGPGPEEYTHGSNEVVIWLCQTSAAHWYPQRIDRKVAGYGCSLCSSRQLVLRVNDLATTDPLLVMEFHPTLNGAKNPELMFAGNEPYYWKCLAAGHVKKQNVPNRRKSRGCVDCEREDRILA
jgi:hypothetical protein